MMLILSYINTEEATLDYHYLKIIRPETKFSALPPPRGSKSFFPLEEELMILLLLAA